MKKYNNAFLSTFVVAVIFISNSNSITLDKRAESQCGLLGESIYCFGGYLENELNDNKLYRLSLSNWPNGTSLSDLNQSWTLVNHSNSEYRLERRRKAAAAVYSNNTLFITGGYTSGSAVYKNQTIAYNRDTNTWHTLNNYTAVSGSVQQIYSATAVSLTPSESTIVLFGGCTENTRFDGVAPLQTDNLNNTVMHEGFTSMQAFQYDRSRWIERSPQTNTPLRFYAGQTATLDPKTGLIYYLGGYYYTAPDYTISIAQDYHTANVFNSKNGNWQTIELSGDKIPSPRLLPTATMLPNSNHILLFGGSETGQNAACIKFCYSLDLDTREWALRTNDALMTADALRFGHSGIYTEDIYKMI
ncbi:hypothetical protein BD408DRAFT_13742 [Parasitella parasitica]|nr:hypothetical protein BD408DRAFT_13742 [Parasitella parasitica]